MRSLPPRLRPSPKKFNTLLALSDPPRSRSGALAAGNGVAVLRLRQNITLVKSRNDGSNVRIFITLMALARLGVPEKR